MTSAIRSVTLALLLVILNALAFAQAYKPGAEPDGFGGIKWGTDMATLKGMEYFRTVVIGGTLPVELWDFDRMEMRHRIAIDIYTKEGDKLMFGKARLASIEYGFSNGRLCEVTVIATGVRNWNSFRQAVLAKYGRGVRVSGSSPEGRENLDWYEWWGKTSEMELLYVRVSQRAKLWIGSTRERERIFEESLGK
jgi:hypothetical protein